MDMWMEKRYDRSVLAIEFIDPQAGPDLDDAGAAASWLVHRGIRSEPTADELAELARLQSTADHLLRTAVTGEAATVGAIDHLNACSAAAAVAPQLNWPPNGRPRMWLSTSGDSGAHVLGVIARSVIELLTGERARLRVCEAHGCQRVYLSASARRRWCSDACGNRVRVARHAARRQLTG
jgi:predicted RNA-binding Zn ribbon-like protein